MPLQRTGQRKDTTDRRGRQGSAMTAAGGTVMGAGLLASGIPGRKEPDALEVFNVRGSTRKKRPHNAAMQQFRPAAERDPRELAHPLSRANRSFNWEKVKSLPRAGVLGFRASTHEGFVRNAKDEMPKRPTLYDKGTLTGKLKSEREIVRGMRIARRVGHGATLGGGALLAGGLHRMSSADQPKKKGQLVRKRESERERGAVAGTAGATAGGAVGLRAGVGAGANTSSKFMRVKMRREWERTYGQRSPARDFKVKGWKASMSGQTGKKPNFVRNSRALALGIKGGALVGTSTVGTAGYLLARGDKLEKRDGQRHDRFATGALAAGGTTAGIGLAGQKVSGKYERKYTRQAKDNTLRAQRIAPQFGGLKVTDAKVDRTFGTVLKPSRVTMDPEVSNRKIRDEKIYNQVPKKHRHEAARLRGMAAQERHFAEVFTNVRRGFGRAKIAGAGVAGAGGLALHSSRTTRRDAQRRQPVRKFEYQPGDQLFRRDSRVSPWRATEAIAGVTLVTAGASRLKMVGTAIKVGSKLPGNRKLPFERAQSVRNAAQRGTRQVGPTLRRNDTMSGAIDLVPARLRPTAATVAGSMMIGHATPIKNETFIPSNRRR